MTPSFETRQSKNLQNLCGSSRVELWPHKTFKDFYKSFRLLGAYRGHFKTFSEPSHSKHCNERFFSFFILKETLKHFVIHFMH